jgi:hypothetical protein
LNSWLGHELPSSTDPNSIFGRVGKQLRGVDAVVIGKIGRWRLITLGELLAMRVFKIREIWVFWRFSKI